MEIIRLVHCRFAEHRRVWECDGNEAEVVWQPLLMGGVKINFDVSLKDDVLVAAAVCRDHRVIYCRFCLTNSLKGEARAAHLAFAMAEDCLMDNVVN